jgi:hypothetical protein
VHRLKALICELQQEAALADTCIRTHAHTSRSATGTNVTKWRARQQRQAAALAQAHTCRHCNNP